MLSDMDAELTDLQMKLAQSRRRLEMTVQATGVLCAWNWDIAANVLKGDARFAAVNNLDPLALSMGVPTSNFYRAIHPDDQKRIRLGIAAILAGAELFSKDYRIISADGEVRWFHAEGRSNLDENDVPVSFAGSLVDVTEQRRIQDQLRIAQVAGGIGTFEYRVGYATISVSDQFCKLFGLHATKMLPLQTLDGLLVDTDRSFIGAKGELPLTHAGPVEFEIARADTGERRWLARQGEFVEESGTASERYVGAIYDVTAAKVTEEKLRAANEELEARAKSSLRDRDRMWENSKDLLAVLSKEGRITDINAAWERVLGVEPDDAIGRPFEDFIRVDEKEPEVEASLAEGEVLETAMSGIDDGTRRVSWTFVHEQDLIYAFGRDITTERQQSLALERTQTQLRQSQKMEAVGQLTGGIAHDFNNMLTGIISAMSILRRKVSKGELSDLDRFISAATDSAQRAASLTHRLLAFSRQQPLDRATVDLGGLVASMEDMLRRTLGEQITLTVNLPSDTWLVTCDANQFENAALNLVINARDAMPSGGTLVISATNVSPAGALCSALGLNPGDYVAFSVSDTGTGMTKETIAKVFEPFYTTKPIGKGTGLGLSMIYGFAQQSGGGIKIDSVVGDGTTMTLYLPRSFEQTSTHKAPVDARTVEASGSGQTVLVIEDDASVRMLIMALLEELGYHGIEATDAETALPVINGSHNLDLIISDVGLPGMNGRQIAELAIERRPGLKVLFVTGYAASAASRRDFLGEGMDMIDKPFAIERLAEKIRTMVAR